MREPGNLTFELAFQKQGGGTCACFQCTAIPTAPLTAQGPDPRPCRPTLSLFLEDKGITSNSGGDLSSFRALGSSQVFSSFMSLA